MKIIKNKHNYKHIKKKNLNSIASVQKQKKNKNFYEHVIIAIKKNKYTYSIIANNNH